MAAVSTVLLRWLARGAKHLVGLPSVSLAHAGGIAFRQRFDSSLRLNPHLHVLLTGGVFLDQPAAPRFVPLPPPDPDDLADLAARLHARCTRVFAKHGRQFEPDDIDDDDDATQLPSLAAALVARRRVPAYVGDFGRRIATSRFFASFP